MLGEIVRLRVQTGPDLRVLYTRRKMTPDTHLRIVFRPRRDHLRIIEIRHLDILRSRPDRALAQDLYRLAGERPMWLVACDVVYPGINETSTGYDTYQNQCDEGLDYLHEF